MAKKKEMSERRKCHIAWGEDLVREVTGSVSLLVEGFCFFHRDHNGDRLLERIIYEGIYPENLKRILEAIERDNACSICRNELLATAACADQAEIVEMLLAEGALPDARDSRGSTPLIAAAELGHAGMVELLIKHGADINATDKSGNTALIRACFYGHRDVVEVLVRSGAACNYVNRLGYTAFTFAKMESCADIAKVLEEHQVRSSANTGTNRCAESRETVPVS